MSFPVAPSTSTLPKWATNNDAAITEPSSDKKGTGWTFFGPGVQYGEAPPFQWFNWLQFNTYNWINYLNDAANYIKAGNFDNGVTLNSNAGVSTLLKLYNNDNSASFTMTYKGSVNQNFTIINGTGPGGAVPSQFALVSEDSPYTNTLIFRNIYPTTMTAENDSDQAFDTTYARVNFQDRVTYSNAEGVSPWDGTGLFTAPYDLYLNITIIGQLMYPTTLKDLLIAVNFNGSLYRAVRFRPPGSGTLKELVYTYGMYLRQGQTMSLSAKTETSGAADISSGTRLIFQFWPDLV